MWYTGTMEKGSRTYPPSYSFLVPGVMHAAPGNIQTERSAYTPVTRPALHRRVFSGKRVYHTTINHSRPRSHITKHIHTNRPWDRPGRNDTACGAFIPETETDRERNQPFLEQAPECGFLYRVPQSRKQNRQAGCNQQAYLSR